MDLKFCHDIIEAHYNNMIFQDGRNKVAFGRTETKCPTLFSTKQYVICTKIIQSGLIIWSINWSDKLI